MSRVLVIAPHPDDETLGCGGSLTRHRDEGRELHWLLATAMTPEGGFSAERIAARQAEILDVSRCYGFSAVHSLGYPTGSLDVIGKSELVRCIGEIVRRIEPAVIYLPFQGDAHSDHRAVFEASAACTKWFRHGGIESVRIYETLSETGYGLSGQAFIPNLWVRLEPRHVEAKLSAMALYVGETGAFPFPRSQEALRAQLALRGSECGSLAAEAFMVPRQVE